MQEKNINRIRIFEPFLWVYFIWYYLPLTRGLFHTGTYGTIFFVFFLAGCAILVLYWLFVIKHTKVKSNLLLPIVLYMLAMTFMVVVGIGDASEHIRVSFTFWGTAIVFYLMSAYEGSRNRLGRLLFVLFFITAVTSLLGVISNPRAARILTYAANAIEEDNVLRMLNIAGISFFQSLVICVPILLTFILQKKRLIFSISALVVIFIALMSASFTISIIMFFVAFALGYVANSNSTKRKCIVIFVIALILIVPWIDIVTFVAENIQNETISTRLLSIVNSTLNRSAEGNLGSRMELYQISLETFLDNPLGLGPKYENVAFADGIGYHSQILDDLARYGVFAIAFYVMFFKYYYKLLKDQWGKVEMSQVALPVTVTYAMFLILNPGFTSEHEGVMMLFLIPVLPDILYSKKKKKLEVTE